MAGFFVIKLDMNVAMESTVQADAQAYFDNLVASDANQNLLLIQSKQAGGFSVVAFHIVKDPTL